MIKSIVRQLMLLTMILTVQTSFAQRTIRINLEQMVFDAGMIVQGTVANVETGVDPQTKLIATFVTIDVTENFYGVTDKRLIIKLLGGSSQKKTVKLAEMPVFTVGEEIISLFFKPSKYGFTSPVGMEQGKFTVQSDAVSKKIYVRNGLNNSQLFTGFKNKTAISKISALQNSNESIEIADFSQALRSLVTILKK